jgi:hypothetical protein
MAMGQHGMAEMGDMEMPLPDNTLPMMSGRGPFGALEMGGMFTTLKVRADLARDDYRDPGWYAHPAGTVAREWTGSSPSAPSAPSAPGTPASGSAAATAQPGQDWQARKPAGPTGHQH